MAAGQMAQTEENSEAEARGQDYVAALEEENRYLRSLLDDAGIRYDSARPEDAGASSAAGNPCAPDQGARIIHREITDQAAREFFSMFWGRTDVYAKRSVRRSTGEAGYYPQCANFWKSCCPRKRKSKIRCQDCDSQSYKKLEAAQIIAHLRGDDEDATDVIGVYPLFPDCTCRFIVFDFDNHAKDAEKDDFANDDDTWREEVDALRRICAINDVDALVERSRSGRGAHLWIFFQKPVDATLARRFGNALLRRGAESVNLRSFRYYDRMLPMQDHLPEGGLGNLIALPMQGRALKAGNSAFVDEDWNAYPDQWGVLLGKKKYAAEFLEAKIGEWAADEPTADLEASEIFEEDGEKPWEKTGRFCKQDVDDAMRITVADGIYVDGANLKPRIQNRIRETAALRNPVFARNQAIGLSNFAQSRYLYFGSDEDGYVKVPRGLQDDIVEACEAADIRYEIADERCAGRRINVSFEGDLKKNQQAAAKAMLRVDNGILNAATAFGKTVVCCDIIAQRKTSTLILLQSSSLMDQWRDALDKFLVIDEELPTYETPSGRVRRRKSLVGTLQGSHDSTTGIVDIAMVGSVCRKGVYHHRLADYGMVILDECHHAASDTIADILRHVRAKYIYGATATPLRGDGLEQINYMLLGPIRYKFTAKDRAREQGIEHLVYPRFTRSVVPRLEQGKLHPNEAYEILRKDLNRDDLIVGDVRECVAAGRTPVVLSRFVDHTQRLYERLQGCADKVFLLVGRNSKKEHRRIVEEMGQVRPDESMILLATGNLVGEGFDFPRLDTLIMATPVAGKSVVEQYAGRLNRDYEGKKGVIVYDYVDSHIAMFDRMYHKRLRAYRQIGYDVYSEEEPERQKTHAIFDMDT